MGQNRLDLTLFLLSLKLSAGDLCLKNVYYYSTYFAAEKLNLKNLQKGCAFYLNLFKLFLGSWSVRKVKSSTPKVVQTRENIFKNIDFLCSGLECVFMNFSQRISWKQCFAG